MHTTTRHALAILAALLCGSAARADELVHDGVKRTYELFVPPNAPPKAPLLLVLHGRFGTGKQVRKETGFDEQAALHGFVVAYPDGLDHRWADARQETLKKPQTTTDDVGFLLALVDALAAKGVVDPARVYVAGHSNGAIMTLTLACTHADRFAGIGVVAGGLPKVECALARPVPAIFFQGTDDPLIPFAGGEIGLRGARGTVLSADDTVKVFADKAGCSPGVKRAPVDKVKSDGTALVIEDRKDCTAAVARVVVEHGGHGWPGRPSLLAHTQEIDATAAIADFFFAGRAP